MPYEHIKVIDVDKLPYAEMKNQYVLVSQDWAYNSNGTVCKSYSSEIQYIDKDDSSKMEFFGNGFNKEAIEYAKEIASQKGLDFIYFGLA